MKKYTRLNMKEREEISRYLALNYSARNIARILNRSTSTVSREILRDKMTKFTYRASMAHWHARKVASIQRKKPKLEVNTHLRDYVIKCLEDRWSPEQIAKSLIFEYPNNMTMRVSHETIYAYLYVKPRGLLKKRLISFLRRRHKNRRSKSKNRKPSNPIQEYISGRAI